ncbi:MAG: 3-deoxy-7-phosphoheptulonate synthase [Gemmatimonadota bacterium]
MIVVMERNATEGHVADVVEALTAAGCLVHRLDGERVMLGTTRGAPDRAELEAMQAVAAVLDEAGPPPLGAGVARHRPVDPTPQDGAAAARDGRSRPGPDADTEPRGFAVSDRWVGGEAFFVIAGPCSVEDPETMDRIAAGVAAAGATALRAGAYKPRSSPYSFQGMGEVGLATLRRAADAHDLLAVSEVLDATQIPVATRYCDVLQVGARNMHNTALLRELGRARRPVLLKRGLAATIDEWLYAAEYVVAQGNPRVILCERGIRTFETATRNTLDLSAVAVMRERSRLPVVVDPSHGTGRRQYVASMALAAIAAGAHGWMIETHVDPDCALSDGEQTISLESFAKLMRQGRAVAAALRGEAAATPQLGARGRPPLDAASREDEQDDHPTRSSAR